jgi:hypothetical protein
MDARQDKLVLQLPRRRKNMLWTPERNTLLSELWLRFPNVTIIMIAAAFGCSYMAVASQAKKLGLPPRYDERESEYLNQEARRCGITIRRLNTMLIRIIAQEKLVDAILDDVASKAALASETLL